MSSFRPPMVSVLLPVYQGVQWVAAAVESMLNQTYPHFELIVIDDGSKDGSADVVARYPDPRIRLYRQANIGLAATLNRAIGLARGPFLARQDQDDISLPQRLEKQVAFLQAHPRCGMVGTWAEIWSGNDRTERTHCHPTDNLRLQFDLLLYNSFVHSSVMLRKTAVEKAGLYATDSSRQPPEDFELWSRLARHFEVANIPEILHVYREVPGSMSRVGANPFLDRLVTISAENLAWASNAPTLERAYVDIPAIMHEAPHRISPRPALGAMRSVLRAAAQGVCRRAGAPPGALADPLQVWWGKIVYHYWVHRIPRFLRPLPRLLAACYRRIAA